MSNSEENKKDRSLTYFHGEAAASSIGVAGEAYQTPSLVSAGASDKEVALLSTLSNLLLSFILIKVPSMLRTGGSVKRVVVLFAVLSVLTWIPLILVLFFFNAVTPLWLILLWVVSLVPSLLTGPLRDDWLAGKIPLGKMGRYLSLRSAISAVVYITAFFFMGYVLDHSGDRIFKGYSMVLFVAFGASLASIFLFKVIKAPKTNAEDTGRVYFGFRGFLKETRRGHIGKFVMYVSLLTFAVNLCSAFFTVYMLRDLHFSYLSYAVVISSEYVARIVSLTFWGRLVDRTGSIKVFGIVSRFIPVIPILWLFSSNIAYLVVIQLISGAIWAAFDLCNQTLIYRSALPDLRLRYIVFNKALSTFAIAVGVLTGAFLLNYVYPIFGSAILGLFLVSGIIRFIIIVILFPQLDKQAEDAETETPQNVPEKKKVRLARKTAPGAGLFYQKRLIPRPVKDRFNPVFPVDSTPYKGAFYHPENWIGYGPVEANNIAVKVVPPKTGIYYSPADWSKYYAGIIVKIPSRAVYPSDISKLGLDKPFIPVMPGWNRMPMVAS